MADTSLRPAWMRKGGGDATSKSRSNRNSDKGRVRQSSSSSSTSATKAIQYTKQKMLSLFSKDLPAPDELAAFPRLYSRDALTPMSTQPLTEDEKLANLELPVNCQSTYSRQYAAGGRNKGRERQDSGGEASARSGWESGRGRGRRFSAQDDEADRTRATARRPSAGAVSTALHPRAPGEYDRVENRSWRSSTGETRPTKVITVRRRTTSEASDDGRVDRTRSLPERREPGRANEVDNWRKAPRAVPASQSAPSASKNDDDGDDDDLWEMPTESGGDFSSGRFVSDDAGETDGMDAKVGDSSDETKAPTNPWQAGKEPVQNAWNTPLQSLTTTQSSQDVEVSPIQLEDNGLKQLDAASAPANPEQGGPLNHALQWVYRDVEGQVQGPFPAEQMTAWFEGGYFQDSLEVKPKDAATFKTLGALRSASDAHHVGPFSNPVPSTLYQPAQQQQQQQQQANGVDPSAQLSQMLSQMGVQASQVQPVPTSQLQHHQTATSSMSTFGSVAPQPVSSPAMIGADHAIMSPSRQGSGVPSQAPNLTESVAQLEHGLNELRMQKIQLRQQAQHLSEMMAQMQQAHSQLLAQPQDVQQQHGPALFARMQDIREQHQRLQQIDADINRRAAAHTQALQHARMQQQQQAGVSSAAFSALGAPHSPVGVSGTGASYAGLASLGNDSMQQEQQAAIMRQQQAADLQKQREEELRKQQQLELQRQREIEAQRQREMEAQRQREIEAQRQREIEAQRQREIEAQRQREIEAQRQREMEAQRQREQEQRMKQQAAQQQQQPAQSLRHIQAEQQQAATASYQEQLARTIAASQAKAKAAGSPWAQIPAAQNSAPLTAIQQQQLKEAPASQGRRQAPAPSAVAGPKSPVGGWGSPAQPAADQKKPTLSEIIAAEQAAQAKKEQEKQSAVQQRARVPKTFSSIASNATSAVSPSGSKPAGSGKKSFLEIQREEEERERQRKQQQPKQAASRGAAPGTMTGTAWAARAAAKPSAATIVRQQQQQQPRAAQQQGKIQQWPAPQSQQQVKPRPQQQQQRQQAQARQQQRQRQLSSTSAKSDSDDEDFWEHIPGSKQASSANAKGSSKAGQKQHQKQAAPTLNLGTNTLKPEFLAWCDKQLKSFTSDVDTETFVTFLMELESPADVVQYASEYLGTNEQVRKFAMQFVERRVNAFTGGVKAAAKVRLSQDAVAPQDSEWQKQGKSKNKGKKKKFTKVDPSNLLGINVAAEQRPNRGDLDFA